MEGKMLHEELLRELARTGQGFAVSSDSISILERPADFYQTLKEGIRKARDRVVLASLYIGTGQLEQELVECVAEALYRNPRLKVNLLFDALRSTRPTREAPSFNSSAGMLCDLLLSKSEEWSGSEGRLNVALYHTPDLAGAAKSLLPARFNEGMGVFHIKAFVFDNTVLMSGANLSTSYFTNRQDRYMILSGCKNVADWLCRLVHTVASFSYSLDKTGLLLLPPCLTDPVQDPFGFRQKMAHAVKKQMQVGDVLPETRQEWLSSNDTWVFPTLQMGPLGILQDELCTLLLFNRLPEGSNIHLASAYFNLTPALESALIAAAASNKNVHILTASPQANGFYGSAGISRFIPHVYSFYEQQFHNRCLRAEAQGRVLIQEYHRPGWTFHAKGAWCAVPAHTSSLSVTIIGSSNFGHRSRHKDLEAQLFLVTRDELLREKLKQEMDALFTGTQTVNACTFFKPGRSTGPFIRAAARLMKNWL